jgi:hypothetical protein
MFSSPTGRSKFLLKNLKKSRWRRSALVSEKKALGKEKRRWR